MRAAAEHLDEGISFPRNSLPFPSPSFSRSLLLPHERAEP
jgi:hypothetical protein